MQAAARASGRNTSRPSPLSSTRSALPARAQRRGRPRLPAPLPPRAAPLDLFAIDLTKPETLVAAGAGLLALLGGLGAAMGQNGSGLTLGGGAPAEAAAAADAPAAEVLPREDAVLVLGATGRAGRAIVQQVCEGGRQ
jgi:uncharacterized protein YbjT (DUF2867 family)